MVRQTEVLDRVQAPAGTQQLVEDYTQGIRAGLAGAFTIAIWFAIVDVLRGQPLHTPTVLGVALFKGPSALADPANLAPSFEMVVGFTWVHMLLFLLVGMAAGRLMELAEHDSHVGLGIVLLFCIFEAPSSWPAPSSPSPSSPSSRCPPSSSATSSRPPPWGSSSGGGTGRS
jgi:hypothetical protein